MDKIEYRKTGKEECDANVYDVFLDGRKIGTMYRAYCPAIGMGTLYVGYSEGCYEWRFDVEEWACEKGLEAPSGPTSEGFGVIQ